MFHEDWHSEHTDPVDGRFTDFDWPGLEAALGERFQDLNEPDRAALCEALRAILAWIIGSGRIRPGRDARIGRRAMALAWVLSPVYFDGTSITAMADALGIAAPALSRLTAEFTRCFGIQNRAQAHGWNRR